MKKCSLTCFVCDKEFDTAANNPLFDEVPYAGTKFYTYGHYGSTCFDSIDSERRLEILICEACLNAKANSHVHIVSRDGKRVEMWNNQE